MDNDQRDVFISYARADAEWVRTLATNLHQSGLEVFFDAWDIAPGDVLVHKLDAGILASRSGILVVSPTALTRPYVQAEYAALMARAIERGQRLIPVLLKDAEMPPLLASRIWIDFRNADGPDYLARVRELVRALKGERAGPPSRTGELSLPPGSGFKVAGALSCRLSIDSDRTGLSCDGVEGAGPPPHADFDFDELQWKLERARANWGPRRDAGGAAATHGELETALHELGGKLAEVFLPAEVVTALAKVVAEAERLNGSLQLALKIADPFADLPWETLRLPQTGALALHPRIELFRRIETGGPAPAVSIPGPLRILVAIGSPEAQNTRGELLDMEAELQRILDATDAPRRAGKAFVHILEQGSVAAIHGALSERRYHVLHISCHAAPGALILEDANGAKDEVTAQRLCDEAIPPERATPLVVLAGCSTGQDAEAVDGSDVGRLPGLARSLVGRGVPAVIAMQASVGDRYATDLMGCVYEALAAWEAPRPLAALGHARRVIEERRRAEVSAVQPPEWATPAFFCSAGPLRLFDASGPFEDLKAAPEPVFDPGVVVRRIGDMVGRRREQRLIQATLRDPDGAGVLIHGIGGVGKSTLAAQILHRLADDDGFLLISLKGETDPDRLLSALATRLFSIGLAKGGDEKHPLRQLAGVLREPKYAWRDRFEVLAQTLLTQVPVAFLFDNFEDNLKDGALADELAALLARWLQAPLLSRLVFTCRYPFALPDNAHERLAAFHLGPLSWAETRKLFWRLDGLRPLPVEDQRRAYENVGGHPRALEYLDAILRGGKARFPDVQNRLRKQLQARGIADPARWCADTGGGLDAALAETVTLAADDVLLDQLLTQLVDDPLSHRLLIGASVYRVPVDELGLIWPVGEAVEQAPDPARSARLQAMRDRLHAARKQNPAAGWSDVVQSASELEQWRHDWAEEQRPPVAAPQGFAAAKQRLMDLSLLAPVRFADDEEEKFLVHRWTAGALARRASGDEQRDAHRGATEYWLWRVDKRPQSRAQEIEDLLEARYHLHALGDLAKACSVSAQVIRQLDTWGAWEWEERLVRETLAWMSEGSPESAALLHQLGNVSWRRGDYDAALEWYRQALEINEQLGNRAGMAGSYGQLGMVAQDRGDYDAALEWCRQALEIDEQLGNRAGMAHTYHALGNVSYRRGDYDAALEWYRQALEINEQLGNRAGMAGSYGQLGNVSFDRGDYDAAIEWYRQALEINEQLGNRADVAGIYHQLGNVSYQRGDYDAALEWYRQALEIKEQLGNRAGMATSYHQLGRVAQKRGDYDAALEWYRQALEIDEQLGNRAGMARTLSQIGILYTQAGQAADAVPINLQSLALRQQIQSPEVRTNLYWLSRQRQVLGADTFRAIVAEHCDAESITTVLALLDEFDRT